MPGQDRTGPMGAGPLTGRGLGSCSQGVRRGFSGCPRMGFGLRNQVTLTEGEEKKILSEELKEIESEKQEIEKRLKEFK